MQVAEHVPHQLKRILGRGAYPLTALALLPRHRPFTARLRVTDGTGNDGGDGTGGSDGTHGNNIANGSHHAGRAIAHDSGRTAARQQDGRPTRAPATRAGGSYGNEQATLTKATSAGPNAVVITSAARSC